jgi:hypothetical protein
MKFSIKVEGVEHQSQLIIINNKKMTLIDSMDHWNFFNHIPQPQEFIKNSELITRYEGREVFAEYLGKSRVDGQPMFRIDTLQLDRDDKISQIIN